MGCLALNASFEPLAILPVERALRLVIDARAEVPEVDDARSFRSQREALPFPTAIRLVRSVHVPRRARRCGAPPPVRSPKRVGLGWRRA